MILNHANPSVLFHRVLINMLLFLVVAPALAVDGVIEISQARALAGGVSSGDTPGFPVTLSDSGSYRLTGNLHTDSKDVTAVSVEADDVTLDLNGFTIACTLSSTVPAACNSASGTGSGIVGQLERVTVKNGVVRDMGKDGVRLGGESRVVDLLVADNGGYGIFLVDNGCTVIGNIASGNGSDGIFAGGSCVIRDNSTTNNGANGIRDGGAATVTGNTATGNGIDGITGSTSVYSNNVTNWNANSGIHSNIGTMIGNTAVGNGSYGLDLTSGGGYVNNVLAGNNGGSANPQVSGGFEMGTNVCGANTTCP